MHPDSYINPQKNHARRTRVNAALSVARGVKGKGGDVVLYLPSKHDADGVLYEKKGVHRANLIGVERDAKLAKEIAKQHRKTVLRGSVFDVVYSWPADFRIGLIDADLMCGLTMDVAGFLNWFTSSQKMNDTTLCLSMSRGQDGGEQFDYAKKVALQLPQMKENDLYKNIIGADIDKSRAVLSMCLIASIFQSSIIAGGVSEGDVYRFGSRWLAECFTHRITRSYRSKGARKWMDTLIVRKHFPRHFLGADAPIDGGFVDHSNAIRAARAVRTMRLNKQLRCDPVA